MKLRAFLFFFFLIVRFNVTSEQNVQPFTRSHDPRPAPEFGRGVCGAFGFILKQRRHDITLSWGSEPGWKKIGEEEAR